MRCDNVLSVEEDQYLYCILVFHVHICHTNADNTHAMLCNELSGLYFPYSVLTTE